MKTLSSLLIAMFFSAGIFAQDKMEKKADTQATQTNAHECYMMKDGALMHCMGPKQEAIKADVKLKNGTVISPKGTMTFWVRP